MENSRLNGKRIAILVTDGFEEVELSEPRKALEAEGAQTQIVSPKSDRVKSWRFTDWGAELPVDVPLSEARPDDFDALLLPGGVINPDQLRTDEDAIVFAQSFLDAGKPVASICHGPWTLIETGRIEGRNMTSWPSLQTDVENAGANWQDREAVVDGNLVTSRGPQDLPAFNREMIAVFAAGARDTPAAGL
jgi:protease I